VSSRGGAARRDRPGGTPRMGSPEVYPFLLRHPVSSGTHLLWCLWSAYAAALLWRLAPGAPLRRLRGASFGLAMGLPCRATGPGPSPRGPRRQPLAGHLPAPRPQRHLPADRRHLHAHLRRAAPRPAAAGAAERAVVAGGGGHRLQVAGALAAAHPDGGAVRGG